MTTKEWFSRCRRLDKRIESLQQQRREEYERITSVTANLNAEVVDGTKDPHKFDRYAVLDDMIASEIRELLDIKCEVKAVIQKVPDYRYRDVLEKRYISGETWEQIAVEMNYSYMHICRLHGEALKAAEEVIPMKK